jgi:hypothetical protein
MSKRILLISYDAGLLIARRTLLEISEKIGHIPHVIRDHAREAG